MTEKKHKILKARISTALYRELGRTPRDDEIKKMTFLASVLFGSIAGAIVTRRKLRDRGQVPLF